jgi:hydrogenase-4 component B
MSTVITGLSAAAAAGWAAASLVGAFAAHRRAGLTGAAWLSALAGAVAVAAGALLALHGHADRLDLGGGVVGAAVFAPRALAAPFVLLLGLAAAAIGLYAPRYHEPGRGTALYLAVYNLALVASLAVLIAANVTAFLVAWETMALLCYLLILRHHRREGVARGAFLFLALSEVGFVLIVAALVILATRTGTLDFAVMAARSHAIGSGWRTAAFLLALAGFGFKAGLVPLHVWLPAAHPVAPSDGSALLSGLIVKLGVYGLALTGVQLLPGGPPWWGLVVLGLGAISALLGILYALMERDLKRFLAFSTVENVGIILTALGGSLTFTAYGQRAIGALLLITALYHSVNHGAYKTLLFLEAGVIEHAAGTRDLDRLGGLVRTLPRSAAISLVGTLAIAALPPLNGFVSEWLLFQGLFQGFRLPSHTAGILIVVAGAAVALTAGLALNAFARAYGIPFLGMARTSRAAHASERGQPTAGPILLAAACVFLGLGAPLVLTALDRVAHAATGVDIQATLVVGKLTIIPAHTDFSGFSPTYLAAFLAAMAAVPLLILKAGRPRAPSRRTPVWDGGILAFKPRMQYTATTHANPVRVTFDPLYRPHVQVERASDDPAGRSGPVRYGFHVTPIFERFLYDPAVRSIEALARLARPIQNGDVNLYLLYVFLVVVVAYAVYAI